MRCDFCYAGTSEENAVRFRAVSFVSHADEKVFGMKLPVGQISDGDWAACPACAILIFADRWEELVDRSAEQFEVNNGSLLPKPHLLAYLSELYREFREARL